MRLGAVIMNAMLVSSSLAAPISQVAPVSEVSLRRSLYET